MIRTALLLLCLLFIGGCTNDTDSAAEQPPAASQATAASATNASSLTSPTPVRSSSAAPLAQVDLEPEPPRADPYDLARRYRGLDVDATPRTQPPAARAGETRSFFVFDLDATRAMEVRATLLAQTEHADIWAQEGQRLSREDAERAGREFETKVYPQVTAAFGSPAPAADGSPGRIAILHAALRGAGGYFSGGDQLPRALVPFSNEQQMVYMDLAAARPSDDGYAGLLAHEFQHLVHQQRSPTADTWINEGLSEVADEMLGGGNAFLRRFETAADTQLNAWPPEESTAPHYGAAHSFLRYLLQHYGGLDRAKDLSGQNAGGVNSVERYLRSGFNTGFLDVFADWTVANLLDETDGRYSQPGINHRVRGTERLPATGAGQASVNQFGTDYLEVSPDGRDVTLRFDGDEQAHRVSVSPVSGRGLWWSNRADSMDSTLTRQVDLRSASSATLRFKLWFNIERDYDYAYVAASRDGGRTWQALAGQQTTDRDPLRVAYGPGYSGRSGGGDAASWVDETIDLSQYAGEQILLRFEYVTDEATTADGFAIDDLSIPEIGWRDDAEADDSWQSSGFLRVTEPLPQRFIVQLVETDTNDANSVRRITLDAANDAEIIVPRTAKKATLVVSGATLGTTSPAGYRWEVRRPG